jgi:hypothetical protein
MTDDILRERLVALEVEMRHMRESSSQHAADIRAMAETVAELRDLLTQAKGARWAILTAIGVGGFIASYLPTLAKWLGMIPKG